MRETLDTKIANASDLLDVLLILKEVTMMDTRVATLAYLDENIQKYDGTCGIWRCKPFPLAEGQEDFTVQAYYFSKKGDEPSEDSEEEPSEEDFKKGKIVVILFMDRNFISNLEAVDKNPKQTTDLTLHSLKFGVILNSI